MKRGTETKESVPDTDGTSESVLWKNQFHTKMNELVEKLRIIKMRKIISKTERI